MKKLYEIETDLNFYLMAESEEEAKDLACRYIREEVSNRVPFYPSDFSANENPEYIWASSENSYPYNSDDNRTVGEIIEEIRENKRKEEEYRKYLAKQNHLFPDNEDFQNRPPA